MNYTIATPFLPFDDVTEGQFNMAVARARTACKFSMPSGVDVPGFFGKDDVKPDFASDVSFLDEYMIVVKGDNKFPRGIYVAFDEAPRDRDGFPMYGAPRAHALAKGSGRYWRLISRL